MNTERRVFATMDRPHEPLPRVEVPMFIRAGCQNDIDVCEEVIYGSGYNLDRMKKVGFNPRTICDIGAHIGSFACFAHAIWPDAKITCVEPHPSSFELLQMNCPWAECLEGEVRGGARPEGPEYKAVLYSPPGEAYGGSSSWFNPDPKSQKIVVSSIMFDDIAAKFERIDLLKLDCEGAEHAILSGMTDIAALKIRAIVGEYHAVENMTSRNAFLSIRQLIQQRCPWLTVITDADRDLESELGSQIGPFLAFDATRDRALFDTRKTALPPQPKE